MDGEEKKKEILGLEWHNTGLVYCVRAAQVFMYSKALQIEGSNLKIQQFSSVSILSSSKEEEDTSLIGTYNYTLHCLGHAEQYIPLPGAC